MGHATWTRVSWAYFWALLLLVIDPTSTKITQLTKINIYKITIEKYYSSALYFTNVN